MSPAEIAAEQIAFWVREGMTPRQCLRALLWPAPISTEWQDVFVALCREARRMGAVGCVVLALLATTTQAAPPPPGSEDARSDRCEVLVVGKPDNFEPGEVAPPDDLGAPIWVTQVGTSFVVNPNAKTIWLFDLGSGPRTIDGQDTPPDLVISPAGGSTAVVPAATPAQAAECSGGVVS